MTSKERLPTRHTKKQENRTYNEENQSIQTDPKLTQML